MHSHIGLDRPGILRRGLTAALLLSLLALPLAGCAKKSADSAEAPEAVTPIESSAPVEQTAVNPYAKIIEGYQAQVGYTEDLGLEKSQEEQQALVAAMKKLREEKSPSKPVFDLFRTNIDGMRSPHSDAFAAEAVSALRYNSFNDYTQFEPYFMDMAKVDAFYEAVTDAAENSDAGQVMGGNFLALKRHSGQVADPELKGYLDQAAEQGYLLISSEGMVYPVVDFTEFAKFKSVYSPEFAALLDQYAYSSVQILVSDGGLVTSPEHLAARALEAERVLRNSAESVYQKYLALVYIDNLSMLLHGTDNSPAFDYETLKVNGESSLMFEKLSALEDSMTATYIQMHLAALEASEGRYDDALYAKINELKQRIKADYKIDEADETGYYNWISGGAY